MLSSHPLFFQHTAKGHGIPVQIFICLLYTSREHEKVIEAEIFPDPEYMEKHTITEPEPLLQELVDRLNGSMPVYKRIARLIVREVPFERTAAGKIKRF